MAADKPDLSEAERAILTNAEEYRRATQLGPLRLANRSVVGLDVPALELAEAEFFDVDFSSCNFLGTCFTRSKLRGIRFDGCEFRGAALRACEADDLVFANCGLERVYIAGTAIHKMLIEDCTISGGSWNDLQIDELSWVRNTFTTPTWSGVAMRAAHWRDCTLRRACFERVTLEGGELSRVSVVDAIGSGLEFRGTVILGLEITLGSFDELRLEAVSGGGIHVADAACKVVRLGRCENLSGVTVSGGECGLLFVDQCKELSLLTLGHSQVAGLSLLESAVAGLTIRSTRLSGQCTVRDCVLDGVDFEGSDVRGLNLLDTRFETLLRVPRTRFSGLKLQGVQYSPLIEIDGDDAVYTDGDSFPAPTQAR